MFSQLQKTGVIGKAIISGGIDFSVHDLRKYGIGKHNDVDDTPFGGGPGMVMKPEPFFNTVEHLKEEYGESPHVLLTSPRGKVIDNNKIHDLVNNETLYILCGTRRGRRHDLGACRRLHRLRSLHHRHLGLLLRG